MDVRIIAYLKLIRELICRRICPDLLFNSEMSLEIDRLIDENDRLRERIRELEGWI